MRRLMRAPPRAFASRTASARALQGRDRAARRRRARRPMLHGGRSTPALISTPSAEPSSTQPSTTRSAAGGHLRRAARCRSTRRAASRRGCSPSSTKSTLPTTRCARPAAHSSSAAWNTSVPTTRCGVSRKTRISARPTSAPEPTDVRPRITPSTSADRDRAGLAAPAQQRGVDARAGFAKRIVRPSTLTATISSAAATKRQQRRVEALAVVAVQRVDSQHAGDRPGHRAERQPLRQSEVDVARAQVAPAAERLGDRAVGEVGADRDDRLHAGEEDQQRRHQRAAADAGQPDEDADAEAEDDDQRVHQLSCSAPRGCRTRSCRSRPSGPRGPPPGCVHGAQPIDA